MRRRPPERTKDLESELQRYAAWFTRRKRELAPDHEREDEERIRKGVEAANRRSAKPKGDETREPPGAL